jgi:hypothetical protein
MENEKKSIRKNLRRLVSITLAVSFTLYPFLTVARGANNVQASSSPASVSLVNPNSVFLPVVSRPVISTIFGAFLDTQTPDRGMGSMTSAGISWVHLDFYWSRVETQVGQRDWTAVASFEAKLLTAARNHLTTILYINDTPTWALKAGFACGAVAQSSFPEMARFLTDLVKRYSAPPFNVRYYELWSEQDAAGQLGCWGDPSDPTYFGGGYYGQMLKTAYPAVKAGDPQAQVLFGGLLMDCNPENVTPCGGDPSNKLRIARFLEGALAAGAGPYFDGISFHAYDYYGLALGKYSNPNWGSAWNTTGPVALAKTSYLRKILAQYNLKGKFLMTTEAALLCGATGQESFCTTADHEATVSAYLIQSYADGMADGLTAKLWFSVAGWRGSGLFDSQLNPLPAYYAFKNVRALLGQDAFVRSITEFPGISGYVFLNNATNQTTWVIWSITAANNPQTIALPSTPIAVYDMYGNALPGSRTLGVGLEPIFIVLGV